MGTGIKNSPNIIQGTMALEPFISEHSLIQSEDFSLAVKVGFSYCTKCKFLRRLPQEECNKAESHSVKNDQAYLATYPLKLYGDKGM